MGPRLFSWAVWHSCRMGARNQEQTRGRIGPQLRLGNLRLGNLRLGNLRVGELHFCPPCTALDQASSLSRKLAYVPGPTFGFVKLLASSGSHCTKWADEQHWQAGFESRLLPDLPLPFIPTLIGLRAFDLVSSRVWWEAATNIWVITKEICLFLNRYFLKKYFYLSLLCCFLANDIDISLSYIHVSFQIIISIKNCKYVFFVLFYTNISKRIIDIW